MNSSIISPVFKSSNVNIEGTFKLPIAPGADFGSSPGGGSNQSGGASVQASARVIETTAEYATIEIVCSCGTVSQIRCNYK